MDVPATAGGERFTKATPFVNRHGVSGRVSTDASSTTFSVSLNRANDSTRMYWPDSASGTIALREPESPEKNSLRRRRHMDVPATAGGERFTKATPFVNRHGVSGRSPNRRKKIAYGVASTWMCPPPQVASGSRKPRLS